MTKTKTRVDEDGVSVYSEHSFYDLPAPINPTSPLLPKSEISLSSSDSQDVEKPDFNSKEFTNLLTDDELLNLMDSIGVMVPTDLPDTDGLSEEEARRIINSWFESSPDRKSMKNRRKTKIIDELSTKYF